MTDSLSQRLADAGQDHLLEGIEALDETTGERFEHQLESIDWEGMSRSSGSPAGGVAGDGLAERVAERVAGLVESGASCELPHLISQPQADSQPARVRGEQLLEAGRVGVVTVAGGRGSRLGSDRPKGLLQVMPVSGRTLLGHFAASIAERSRRAGRSIPWLVMTSPATDRATREYFGQQRFFGLDPDQVVLFEQGTLPAIDAQTGRVLLAEPGRVALCPDGHGGMVEAIKRAELFGWLDQRGVDTLFYHQVDNPAVLPPDPLLVGWHDLAAAEMTTRVVPRRSAGERMGVAVAVDSRTRIVEYVDLPVSAAEATDEAGRLRLWAGNIAVHVLDCRFLARAADADRLPLHRVRRKVPYSCGHASGRLIEPDEPNAFVFERLIFDLLDLLDRAESALVVEGDRGSDFLPVKQSSGEDSLEAARAGLVALHRDWLAAAGAHVGEAAEVEITPAWALSAADVAARVGPDDVFEGRVVLE